MLPLDWIGDCCQQKVGEVDTRAKRGAHLVRDIGAVHSGEAVLGLSLAELLDVRNVLQEDKNTFLAIVV